MSNKIAREFDLNSVLAEIGSFGKFQFINLLFIIVPICLTGIYSLSFVFTAGNLNYRCRIPICDVTANSSYYEYNPQWLEYAVPFKNERPNLCEHYSVINKTGVDADVCVAGNFNRNVIETCNEFVYESDEKTIVNEFHLTCNNNQWKLSLVGTINVIGTFLCSPLTGIISDLYGRRLTLIIGMIGAAIFGVLRSFSWNYISFMVFEFLDPLIGSGAFTSGYILALELIGPKHRLIGATCLSFFFAFGRIILGIIAMYTLNWRYLLLITYIPAFLIGSYYWLVPESVHWLYIKGQTDQVIKILRWAAKVNNVVLEDATLHELQNLKVDSFDQNTAKINHGYGLIKIFNYPKIVIRVVLCSLCWFTTTFVYYGLSLGSVTFSGDKFINFILFSLSDLPGCILCFYLNNYVGRKKTLAGSLIVSGICCIVSIVSASNKLATLILLLIGKCAITTTFETLYIYSAELFPTMLRHSLLSISLGFGRIGNMLAPQMTLLDMYVKYLPMFLYGGLAIISGVLAFNFPETLNKPLPDTLDDADQMKRKRTEIVDSN